MIEVALLCVSIIVFLGLIQRKNMWVWICLYWLILSIRNMMNL